MSNRGGAYTAKSSSINRLLSGALALALVGQSFPAWAEGQAALTAGNRPNVAPAVYAIGSFANVPRVALGALKLNAVESRSGVFQTAAPIPIGNAVSAAANPVAQAVASPAALTLGAAVPAAELTALSAPDPARLYSQSPAISAIQAQTREASGRNGKTGALDSARGLSRLGIRMEAMPALQAYEALRNVVDGAASRHASADALSAQASSAYAGGTRSGAVLSRFVESVDSFEVEWADKEGAAESAAEAAKDQPGRRAAASEQKIYKTYRWGRRLLILPLLLLYRVKVMGELPAKGPALLIFNHPSYIDVVLVSFVLGRPIRFFMFRKYFEADFKLQTKRWYMKPVFVFLNLLLKPFLKLARWFFWGIGAIPVSHGDSKARLKESFFEGRRALRNGEVVGIFPTGEVTQTGNYFQKYKHGFEKVAEDLPIPVVPVAIEGLWGSFFSYGLNGSILSRFFQAFRNKLFRGRRLVILNFGKPLSPKKVSVQTARETVQELGADAVAARLRATVRTLPREFLRTAKRAWLGRARIADSTGKELSYGKAFAASLILAGLLRGLLPASPNVGILVPPSVGGALTNAAVGILGKVAVNLNYSSDRETVEHAVQKAKVRKIITSRKALAVLKEKIGLDFDEQFAKEHFIYLEDLLPKVSKIKFLLMYLWLGILPRAWIERIYLQDASRSLDDVAAIVFTTGSTKKDAKGAMLTHLNIQAQAQILSEVVLSRGKTNRRVLLGVLPFFHVFGYTVTLWLPLLKGLSVVWHTHPKDTGPIAEISLKYRPNALMGTPSFLRKYAEELPPNATAANKNSPPKTKRPFAFMELVISGAAKLWPAIARLFKERFGLDILEGYGVTEASPVISVNLLDSLSFRGEVKQVGNKPGTVGQPIPGMAVRVMDTASFGSVPEQLPQGRHEMDTSSYGYGDGKIPPGYERHVMNTSDIASVPEGMPGMLMIKGPNVMVGYFEDPAETEEAFRDGWYVTGDVVTIDRDGFITIVDRFSNYGKVEGEMVSPGKVQERLHQAAGLKDEVFVVSIVPDEKLQDERLVVLYERDSPAIDKANFKEDGSLKPAYIQALLDKLHALGLHGPWKPHADSFFSVAQIPMAGSGKPDLKKVRSLAQGYVRAF